MDAAGPSDPIALIGTDAAFAAIVEAWFELLACGGSAVDLAACPAGRGGSPALLDVLAGVQLSEGVLGAYTPSPLQEPAHLEGHVVGWLGAECTAGHGWPARLCRVEWGRMLEGCREAWGPNLFLRKALAAVGPHGSSLLASLVLGGRFGGPRLPASTAPARAAAALMMLRTTGQVGKTRSELHAHLRRALPDGEAISNSLALEELLIAHEAHPGCAPLGASLPASAPKAWASAAAALEQPRPASAPAAAQAALAAAPSCAGGAAAVDSWAYRRCPCPRRSDEAVPAFSSSSSSTAPAPVSSQVPHTFLADPCRRVGADVAEGLLVEPAAARLGKAAGSMRCCICLEDHPAASLRHCGRTVCGKSAYCLDCLRQHAETVVHGGLYAAPSVRCPACNRRLGTEAWAPLVGEATLTKYRENSRALLTYRCAACDESNSYFTSSGTGRDPFAALDQEVRDRVGEAWRRFFLAETSAEDFLQAVLDEHSCGHRCGGTPPVKLAKVFGPSGGAPWVIDPERRLAIQLAWMHRFPKQRTPCCGERFCFRCKVSSWHRGITCEERLETEKARQAQLCPGCGVPTQRSEGCRKITCVCGRVWEWEGDESSEEGTFSDEGSEEEAAQAQTPVNLIAMNVRASEESVWTVVQALVNAHADLNQSVAPASEAPSPLLMAAQYRHPAAVAALCEHGARVTPEVLEEVKLISQDSRRTRIDEILRPQVQGDPNMKLPLWVWVQAGSLPAVEALLRNAAHDEAVGADVFIALHRSRGDEDSRRGMTERLREHVGEARFRNLQTTAATRMLMLELRQAHDEERDVEVATVREALALGADATAREEGHEDEDEAEGGGYGLTALDLVAMNRRGSPDSVRSTIEALLESRADVNAETEAVTPLLAALHHCHVAAAEALCKGPVKFTGEILDEVKTLSEPSHRRLVLSLLWPMIQAGTGRRLPLWVWVQDGTAVAVEALLRSAPTGSQLEELSDVDTFTALQRCSGDEASRSQIEDSLRSRLDASEFQRLTAAAASRRLLQELGEASRYRRDFSLETIRDALAKGADPNVQDEEANDFEDEVGSYSLSAMQLMVTNDYASSESMQQAVWSLVQAKADVNMEAAEEPPLLMAVQHRCASGVEALSRNGAKVTPEILEELKSVSGKKARDHMEGCLRPLVESDKSLRCPLWMWVQFGCAPSAEALLRNAAHEEEVDTDVVVSLQRCSGDSNARRRIADQLREHLGEEEFNRLEAAAATRRLLQELREAHNEERDPDLEVVCDCLALGANPNAREEEPLDEEEEEEEEEELEEEEDEEEEEDGDEEDDEDDEEDGADEDEEEDQGEPEEELDEDGHRG